MRTSVLFLAAVTSLNAYAAGPAAAGGGSNASGGGGAAPAAGGAARSGGGGAAQAPANSGGSRVNTDASNANNTSINRNVQSAAQNTAAANQKIVDSAKQNNAQAAGGGRPGDGQANTQPQQPGAAAAGGGPGAVVYPWSGYYGSGYWSSPGNGPSYYDNTYGNAMFPNGGNYRSEWDDTGTVQPPTNADAATRTQIESARAQMQAARTRLAAQFRSNESFVQADREAKEAQAEYNDAVRKARGNLRQSGEYRDAVTQKREAQQQVEAAQAAHRIGPTTAPTGEYYPPQAVQAAQQKLNAATEVSSIERDQFEQDPDVRKARERLDTAVARVNQLKHEFDATLASDAQWSAAKGKLDSAMAGATR